MNYAIFGLQRQLQNARNVDMAVRKRMQCVRTTISMPGDIKARMNDFERRHCVNWSAIFVRAAVTHMDKVEPQRKETNGAKH